MSNKSGRKSHTAALTEEKEKRTDSPVKEMKKKIAANAEKEKQVTDKTEKTVTPPEKADKNIVKATEKPQNEKTDNKKAQTTEKVDKTAPTPEKNAQKPDKNTPKQDKPAEKTDKSTEKEKPAEKADKKTEKVAEKKADKPAEKKTEPEKKEETNGDGKNKQEKPKQNGAANGDTNGVDTVSEDSSSEELVIDEQDEMFPELTYADTSEEEDAPSRSLTRRSQVKATKTPETPRPASYKEDDSKEKVLKMNDSLATDRKLRSADSPKREPKKPEKVAQDSPKKDKIVDLTDEKSEEEKSTEKSAGKSQLEMDVVIEVESMEEPESRGKTRARVSPYSRPKHDQTTSSMMANYTGNNTTMEMDITESSILEDSALDDSYLRGLRTIRGRASYRQLKELSLHSLNRSVRSANTSLSESRPTGTVVGRKRKPDEVEVASEASELVSELVSEPTEILYAQNKRMRLFDKFSVPFRGFNTRRAAEIVGINTDLPLTAPVASPPFDPESLKGAPSEPIAVPLPTPTPTHEADAKRCVVM